MEEFSAELVVEGADGSLAPFHIYVGAPETQDGVQACLWWCSLMKEPHWQGGSSPEQAYREAFKTIARLVDSEQLRLRRRDGSPFEFEIPFPSPPDEQS
ncbi:MAG: hypothetical protein K2X44_03010 [Magnetospirillum sp.]|nr:hypothetical protein [Magnetospirillum sp.]